MVIFALAIYAAQSRVARAPLHMWQVATRSAGVDPTYWGRSHLLGLIPPTGADPTCWGWSHRLGLIPPVGLLARASEMQALESIMSFIAHHAGKHGRKRLWHDVRVLLSNPEAVPFFAMSLLMGFGVGVLSTYLFLYLDELGTSYLNFSKQHVTL